MKGRILIALLVAFTVFITWRAKRLEQTILGRPSLALISKPAPSFDLTSLDGSKVSLADYLGKKKLVVSFWASWCGPCRMELPALRKFYEQNRKHSDEFEILAISIDEDREAAESFATKTKLSFPVLLDSNHKAADAYSVEGIPVLYVIDKSGKVLYGHEGLEPGLAAKLNYELGFTKLTKESEDSNSAGSDAAAGNDAQKETDGKAGH